MDILKYKRYYWIFLFFNIFIISIYSYYYTINITETSYYDINNYTLTNNYEGSEINSCLVEDNIYAHTCSLKTKIVLNKSEFEFSGNSTDDFNCYLLLNESQKINVDLKSIDENETHKILECRYYPSYPSQCNDYTNYSFYYDFNTTSLPQEINKNLTIGFNLSYRENGDYHQCRYEHIGVWERAPLPLLNLSYTPLNGSRSYINGRYYAYVGDCFNVSALASNINDVNHSGKLVNSSVNITNLENIIDFNLLSPSLQFLGNISSGENTTKIFEFCAKSENLSGNVIKINLSDWSGYYSNINSIEIVPLNLSFNSKTLNATEINYGEWAKLIVGIKNNASAIENVTAEVINIKTNQKYYFSNITSSAYYAPNPIIHQPELTEYSLFIHGLRSGTYKIYVEVIAGKTLKEPYQTSIYDLYVKQGSSKVEATQPLYYILENQTIPYNITITELDPYFCTSILPSLVNASFP